MVHNVTTKSEKYESKIGRQYSMMEGFHAKREAKARPVCRIFIHILTILFRGWEFCMAICCKIMKNPERPTFETTI